MMPGALKILAHHGVDLKCDVSSSSDFNGLVDELLAAILF